MAERTQATTPRPTETPQRDDIQLTETHGALAADKLATEDARSANRAASPDSLSADITADRSFVALFRQAVAIQTEDFRSFHQGVAEALKSPQPGAAIKQFFKERMTEDNFNFHDSLADTFEKLARDMRESATQDSLKLTKIRG